ncbi:MAG: DMT family transporter [Saprospiraceae bacterium]|nr:DMT family transporter [Saprospiraceae bacterium]
MSNSLFWFCLVIALLAGAVMPTQAAVNHKLSTYVHHPVYSAIISFGVGTVALLGYLLAAGLPLKNLWLAKNAPLIAWTGGLLGAFFVSAIVWLVPRLGVALTFSIVITGQMLITLLIDHYGFLDVPVKAINLPRVLGVVLVVAGVLLFRRF